MHQYDQYAEYAQYDQYDQYAEYAQYEDPHFIRGLGCPRRRVKPNMT